MEVRRLLLVAGLLAALLPAAATTFGPQQPGAPCEPTLLATQVSLFCAPDMPTAQCCEPVVAAVDLGGGVPCLCRVAAEPQLVMAGLNATHLLALYTSCGGLRPGGAHLAAACEGPAHPAAAVDAPPLSPAPRSKQPDEVPPLPASKKLTPHRKQLDLTHPPPVLDTLAPSPSTATATDSPAIGTPPANSTQASSSSDHGILVGILVGVVVIVVIVLIIGIKLIWTERDGWFRIATATDDTDPNNIQQNVFVINPPPREVNRPQTERPTAFQIGRCSPRLKGLPAGPPLPNSGRRGHARNTSA